MVMNVHNLGNVEISPNQIRSALARVAMTIGLDPRTDGIGGGAPIIPAGAIERYRQRLDGMALQAIRDMRGSSWEPAPEIRLDAQRAFEEGRVDALTPGPAGFLRDFDYIHRELLEERRPQLNAGMLFPADTSVPLGAPTHTVRRAVTTGRARWHNKGEGFPLIKAGYIEEQFRTGFAVCAVEQSFFEGLQLGFAGLQTYRIEATGAIRAIEEFLNEVAFYGDPARQIYGALTYPHLAKMVLPVQFGGVSTGAQIAAQLHALVDAPMIQSSGVFRPNRLVTSEAVHQFLATTPLNTAGGDVTIKEFFLKGQSQTSGIRDIEIAHELSAAEMTAHGVGNPAGRHGIFAYRDDKLSVSHVLPQRPTFLPIWQSSPIDTLHVAFASTGGTTMHDVGNNVLGFVQL